MSIEAIAPAGHNQPPSAIDYAREACRDLNSFLGEHPVIQNDDQANKGALLVKNMKRTLDDMEDERTKQVKPLNDEVKAINDRYRTPRDTVEKILNELKRRLSDFARAEEQRRWQEAEEKRLAAEAAEKAAREAEAREREAIEAASVGEIGVDIEAVTVEADAAFAEANKLNREAARAERDSGVKMGADGFGRALSLRTRETLYVDDAAKALKAIGLTDKIREAILSGARDYRKLKGKLPTGIHSETERAL